MSDGLDEVIHSPKRLAICAFLATVTDAEFGLVRDNLGVSDSVMSKHVSALVTAGYVESRRLGIDGRPHVWLRLTREGRLAFEAHVKALRALLSL